MTCACTHWRTIPPAIGSGSGCMHPAVAGPEGTSSGAMCGREGEAILSWLATREGACPGVEAPRNAETARQRGLFG